MGNHGAPSQLWPQLAHDGFARKPVESVALKAAFKELASEGKTRRKLGNGVVEGGIETGDVGNAGKSLHRLL
jgi:hypothetical protein